MTARHRWLSPIIGAATIASFALSGIAVTAHAAGASSHAHKAAAVKSRCAKRVTAKGTAKYSDWQFPSNLNSYQNSEVTASNAESFMFDGLAYYDQKLKLKPDMLTSVPSLKNKEIQNGGKTIILKLKKNLLWSNGTEITSKDIKFGWQVNMDKLTGPACEGSCDIISRIDTPNKYEAILHLKQVYAPAVPNAFPGLWPTKWTATAGSWNGDAHEAANQLAQNTQFTFEDPSYPTTGPYQIAEYVKDNRIVFKPNKYYDILSCGAYIKNLIFAFYSSKPDMIAAASNHDTDVTTDYTLFDIPELNKHSGYKTLVQPALGIEHLEFNLDPTFNGAPNPLHETKVRQALALAIDRVGLIQSALGVSKAQAKASEATTVWIHTKTVSQPYSDPRIKGQWDPIIKKYIAAGSAQALKDAKKLLGQTQYKNGFTVDFHTTSGNPVRAAQESVIANSLAKIGVTVSPVFVPSSKMFGSWDTGSVIYHGAFQIAMFAFFFGGPDPDGAKYNFQSKYIDREQQTHSTINGNDAGIHDAAIDKAFNVAAHTYNSSLRRKEYYIVQDHVNQNAYWFPLFYRPNIATVDNRVKGVSNNPNGILSWNPWQWKATGA